MTTSTLDLVQTNTTTNPLEAAHIVLVPPGQNDATPQAYVLRARIEGLPVEALCGFTWIPNKNPEPLPVCKTCLDIFEAHGHDGKPDA